MFSSFSAGAKGFAPSCGAGAEFDHRIYNHMQLPYHQCSTNTPHFEPPNMRALVCVSLLEVLLCRYPSSPLPGAVADPSNIHYTRTQAHIHCLRHMQLCTRSRTPYKPAKPRGKRLVYAWGSFELAVATADPRQPPATVALPPLTQPRRDQRIPGCMRLRPRACCRHGAARRQLAYQVLLRCHCDHPRGTKINRCVHPHAATQLASCAPAASVSLSPPASQRAGPLARHCRAAATPAATQTPARAAYQPTYASGYAPAAWGSLSPPLMHNAGPFALCYRAAATIAPQPSIAEPQPSASYAPAASGSLSPPLMGSRCRCSRAVTSDPVFFPLSFALLL